MQKTSLSRLDNIAVSVVDYEKLDKLNALAQQVNPKGGITLVDFLFLDIIFQTGQTSEDGWSRLSRPEVARKLGITGQSVFNNEKALVEIGFLETRRHSERVQAVRLSEKIEPFFLRTQKYPALEDATVATPHKPLPTGSDALEPLMTGLFGDVVGIALARSITEERILGVKAVKKEGKEIKEASTHQE